MVGLPGRPLALLRPGLVRSGGVVGAFLGLGLRRAIRSRLVGVRLASLARGFGGGASAGDGVPGGARLNRRGFSRSRAAFSKRGLTRRRRPARSGPRDAGRNRFGRDRGLEVAWTRGGGYGRRAFVDAGPQALVGGRDPGLLQLAGRGRDAVVGSHQVLLFGRRPGIDAAPATIVADPVDRRIVDHGLIIDGVDADVGDIVDRAVIVELVAFPVTALITVAAVAIAIVHAAVKADVRPPVAIIEDIAAADPAPVRRGPQDADAGRLDPGARHPVIVIDARVPGPVARGPHIARRGDRRLDIDRQGRRRDADADADRDLSLGGHGRGGRSHAEAQNERRD